MTALPLPRPRRPDWRKAGLATASVAINTALIAFLSFTAPGIKRPDFVSEPPPIYVEITPRPLLPDEQPRIPVQTPHASDATTTPRNAREVFAAPSARQETPQDVRPAPLRPRIAAPSPQGVPAPPDAWTVNPNDRSNAMARALRQGLVGCSTPQQLNAAERANCREDALRGLNAAPITGTGNPERDAAFAREGARRLAQWEAQRRPLSGGVGVVGPADCVGSNFGTGCAGAQLPDVPGVDMRQGAETTINRGERRRQGFSASIGGLRIGGKED